MSLTSGFFNSVNQDRRYNAEQMSAIFDGVINDGVFANIGTAFEVKASSGYTVNIGIGRAWFNSTWINNDAILPIELDIPEAVLDRIDAVVFDVDHSDAVRNATIKVIKGTPSTAPQRPTLIHSDLLNQYPLCYILRVSDSSSITQANITNMIGTSSCPYITGILQVQNIDNIVAQWEAQWIEWFSSVKNESEQETDRLIDEWNQWFTNETQENELEAQQWLYQMKSDIIEWFNIIKDTLDDDTATALGQKIVEINENFKTMLQEECIYDMVMDSVGRIIQDSNDTDIRGKGMILYNLKMDLLQNMQDINNKMAGILIDMNRLKDETQTDFSKLDEHIDNKDNPHNVTYDQTGAAAESHTHAISDFSGTLPVSKGGTGQTNLNNVTVGKANTLATPRTIAISGGVTGTATSFNGSANISIPVTKVDMSKASGTIPVAVKATNSTDYTTSRLRNIRASTTDLTPGSSTLSNGEIYLVYE